MRKTSFFLVIASLLVLLSEINSFGQQDLPNYNCAANTLPINQRICIGISETPAYMYKDFLAWMAEEKGMNAPEFKAAKPDFSKWKDLFPSLNTEKIEDKFQNTDQLALMPIVGITKSQAERYCEWRTEMFEAQLAEMSKRERALFPKKFKFRLPTANEWSRMRFLIQEKAMMKQLSKIASANRKAFKYSKSRLMVNNKFIEDIYGQKDSKLGFYNLFSNVSELTSTEGEAIGGSWFKEDEGKNFKLISNYTGPESWLGFRIIFEIIE
ncbi:SUMF1/EgtB/PvdO family nonheme iron enzyme [Roseivirga sp.]|uniref:SUMF1/EgtB/PvdO family nonheme iron enzyme n=1 Tax=Roseivirga sp. TaxID=1964215 RepID=UPI003B8D4CB0